jgi:hypothetical protein
MQSYPNSCWILSWLIEVAVCSKNSSPFHRNRKLVPPLEISLVFRIFHTEIFFPVRLGIETVPPLEISLILQTLRNSGCSRAHCADGSVQKSLASLTPCISHFGIVRSCSRQERKFRIDHQSLNISLAFLKTTFRVNECICPLERRCHCFQHGLSKAADSCCALATTCSL